MLRPTELLGILGRMENKRRNPVTDETVVRQKAPVVRKRSSAGSVSKVNRATTAKQISGRALTPRVRARARTNFGQDGGVMTYEPKRRAEFLVHILGNQGAADILSVSKSQPSRWKTGKETPSPVAARRLVDLDHVLARFLLLWDKSLAQGWLTSSNGFLDGARPIDVILTKGSSEVIDAIEAEAAETFA